MSTIHDEDDEDRTGGDVIADIRSNSIEEGVFGVFFTVSREKKPNVALKWALLYMFVDFLQVLSFFLNREIGWAWQLDVVWNILAYFTIKNPILSLGYGFFLACFGCLAAALIVSLVVCGFVGYLFKTNSFPYVWPIKFVRLFFTFLVGVFYISSLKVFLFSLACVNQNVPKPFLKDFTFQACWEMPHFVVAVLGGIFAIVLSITGLGVALMSFEPVRNLFLFFSFMTPFIIGRTWTRETLMRQLLAVENCKPSS